MNPFFLTLPQGLILGSQGCVIPETPKPKSFCSLPSQILGSKSNFQLLTCAPFPPRGVQPTPPGLSQAAKIPGICSPGEPFTPGRAPSSPSFGIFSVLGIRSSTENPGKQQEFVGEGESGGDGAKPQKPPQNQPLLLEGDPDLPEPDFRMGKLQDFSHCGFPGNIWDHFHRKQDSNNLNLLNLRCSRPLTSQPDPATKPRPGILFQTEIPALALDRANKTG